MIAPPWPLSENLAPITFVLGERVYEDRLDVGENGRTVWRGGVVLTEENRGIVWARGWGTPEANALRVAVALGVLA